MSVLWTFLLVTAFVALFLLICTLRQPGTLKLNELIKELLENGFFQLQPTDWLSKKGFKVVHDDTGSILYVQYDAFGFFTCYYTPAGDFISENYYAFDGVRDTDGVPSDLPADSPESR